MKIRNALCLASLCLATVAHAAPGSIQFKPGTIRVQEDAGSATVTVQRVGGTEGRVSARWSPNGGSASKHSDYPFQTNLVIWEDGDAAEQSFAFEITNDQQTEPNETLQLNLSNPVGASLGSPSSVTVVILDEDDGSGKLAFRNTSSRANESTLGARIPVSRTNGSTGEVRVRWSPNGGSATKREDYDDQLGLLTWADGDTADKYIEFAFNDDFSYEGRTETVRLTLANAQGGASLGARKTHTLIIEDDDKDFSVDAGLGSCNLPAGRTVIEQWTDRVGAERAGLLSSGVISSHSFNIPAACDIKEMDIRVEWANNALDLDLSVTDPSGTETVSERGNTGGDPDETISLVTPTDGGYTVNTYGYLSGQTEYRGTVTVDIGAVSECDAAFNGLPVGASIALVDPNLDFEEPGTLILSFASAAGRDAALGRLRANLMLRDGIDAQGLRAFNQLHAVKVPSKLISMTQVEMIRDSLNGLDLISIWGEPKHSPLINSTVPLIGVDAAREHFVTADLGLQGEGVGVAVIDTGVDKLQGDLKAVAHNVRMLGPNAVEMENSETNEGHGTHIAGTIVGDGTRSAGHFVGVAPKATLVGIGVDVGAPYLFTLDGIDYVLEQAQRFNIRVTNHSYGPATGSGFRFDAASADALAIRQLYNAGIISVFAAGNSGPSNDTISANAQNPCVIAVANGDRSFELASTSSRGTPDNTTAPGPDITAPGTNITASRALNGMTSTPLPEASNPYYATISGTSMATPHVVGVIALMLEANPNLSFEDVHGILSSTARAMPGYGAHEVGAGYIDALGAIAAALSQPKPSGALPLTVGPGATTVYSSQATSGLFAGVICSGCPSSGNNTAPHNFDFLLPATLTDAAEVRFRVDWADELDHLNLSVFGPDNDANLVGSSAVIGTSSQEVVATPTPPALGVATGRYLIEIDEQILTRGIPFTVSVDVVRPAGAPAQDYDRSDFQPGGPTLAQCEDGVDNDGDGLTDFGSDPGCDSPSDNDETDPPPPSACSNGTDDDGDGWVDLADAGCSSSADNDETDAGSTECSNGIDDDGDGAIDSADDGCADGRDTQEFTAPPVGCSLGSGDQVVHQWTGTLGPSVLYASPTGGAEHNESVAIALPAGCNASKLTVRVTWDQPLADMDIDVVAHGRTETGASTQIAAGTAAESIEYAAPEIDGSYAIRTRAYTALAGPAEFRGEIVVSLPESGSNNNAARVLVAVLDSGILPYHDFYYADSSIYPGTAPSSVTPALLAELGIDAAHQIELTRSGNFAADYAADAAIWAGINRGELYWFKGTNIIAASYDTEAGRRPILPDPGDTSGEHGVGTSAAVLLANPDAVIIFGEFGTAVGAADVEDFGFLMPAVDIISTSYGFGDPVLGTGLPIPFTGVAAEAVMEQGKLHFSSAANSPDPTTPESGGAGPWWTIAIGGIEEGSSNGRTTTAGYFIDFVSDFTQQLPYCYECESGLNPNVGGTSFATPRSAGVASKVLLEARRNLNHLGGTKLVNGQWVMAEGNGQTISNWQIRRALEVAAYYDQFADYDPIEGVFDIFAHPPIDVAPWLHMGWGNLTALPSRNVVAEALAQLGFGSATRTKSAEACDFQTINIRRRKTYWDAPGPGWFLNAYDTPSNDPFIYCGSVVP